MKKTKLLVVHGKGEYKDEYISFQADKKELFGDYDAYTKYVKSIEDMVRLDDRYVRYTIRLKEGGLDHCAILGNLPTDDPQLKIDIHHGPIFNLFDICDIILRARLKRGYADTVFDLADLVLTEHEEDNIMVIPLSRQVHIGGVHNKKATKTVFLSLDSTWGRLDRFIDKWHDGMIREHYQAISKYCKECAKINGSTDQNLFAIAEKIKSFK